jgi:outer membrane protein OmpA-like peptidoglycan-associated protein
VSWDGRTQGVSLAEEGRYHAVFTVRYVAGDEPEARTESDFVLDVTAPDVSVSVSPKPFSPDDDGIDDNVTIGWDATDENGLGRWALQILDPADNAFVRFSGEGSRQEPIQWDGSSREGELVQAASDYTAMVSVADVFGNETVRRTVVPVDVFAFWEGGKRKIRISSIHFVANEADYENLEPEKVQQNRETLDRLAEILKRFEGHQIQIEGYCVSEWWQFPARAKWEQENELLPLSRERARVIKEALVKRGVDEGRLSTVGHGGENPAVPHGDLENRWKNRRVEFVLKD